ncbi:MAG: hypothetical protein IPN44_10195 [Flavobacteriales bacterium]|nr:hypothetical protein [Flavobacteriales bacterium]
MDRPLPNRRTIRMRGYDYAQEGAYYVTICTDARRHWFGHIAESVVHRSFIGELAQQCWDAIPEHMPHVDIGEFVVMPNHVHGIVIIRERMADARGVVGSRHGVPDNSARHGVPDGSSRHGVPGNSSRHGVPGIHPADAPDTTTNASNTDAMDAHDHTDRGIHSIPDDHGTEMRDDTDPVADAHAQHTRARLDAPLRDQRKPLGIPHGALGQIVASYKSAVTRIAYRNDALTRGTPVWQQNFWDHIIRNDAEHQRIANYIRNNPKNWKEDRFNG